MKKKLITIMTTLLVTLSLVGCGSGGSNEAKTIKISGSTSVAPLMEKEAELYKEKIPNCEIEIQAIGSSAGVKNAIENITEIGMVSRDLNDEEKASGLKEQILAYDGIGIIAHKNNNIENLTKDQLKDIYIGKIKNWKEVGGKDSPIVVVSREEGSGTRDAFQEILKFSSGDLVENATIADGSGNIKTIVSENENCIGYISFEYIDESIKSIKLDGIEPTSENVKNEKYKLSRPFLIVYMENNLKENGKSFVEFMLSDEGQKIVEKNGLIKVK